jgi:hypothetical protein
MVALSRWYAANNITEQFGIVSVDCAKARFKWMLCDFYGKVVPPISVEHNRHLES